MSINMNLPENRRGNCKRQSKRRENRFY